MCTVSVIIVPWAGSGERFLAYRPTLLLLLGRPAVERELAAAETAEGGAGQGGVEAGGQRQQRGGRRLQQQLSIQLSHSHPYTNIAILAQAGWESNALYCLYSGLCPCLASLLLSSRGMPEKVRRMAAVKAGLRAAVHL